MRVPGEAMKVGARPQHDMRAGSVCGEETSGGVVKMRSATGVLPL